MKRFCLLTTFLMTLLVSQTFAQEVCNNGIDDDGNGFIDCYDRACAVSTFCEGFYLGDDATCEVPPAAFPAFSLAIDFFSPDDVTNNLSRMAIGDLDRDGMPEIITMNRYDNTNKRGIYILNGNDGQIKDYEDVNWEPLWEIAIANIDNDNCAEIFTFGSSGGRTYLYALDCNLNQLWRSPSLPGDPINFGVADFDGDGLVEIYAKNAIYDAKTGTRLVNSTGWNVNGGPVAADMDDDGKLELVIGCAIYEVNLLSRTADAGNLSLVSSRPEYFRRYEYNASSVADFNQDGHLDVIASGSTIATNTNTTIFFWDVFNNTLDTYIDTDPTNSYYPNGWGNGTGRVNIADLDGDGNLNLSYVSGKYLYALDHNLDLLWRKNINEETSGHTGCTLFDFNGDGESEIVYRDEQFLYIINGNNGTAYGSPQPCVSRTNREYPIVADVDADGQTEICVPCITDDAVDQTNFNSNAFLQTASQIRIYKSASVSDPWVPARRLWNQHGYFNVNVNDDLTIPRVQQKHHLVFSTGNCTVGPNRPLNNFLNQSPFLNIDGCPTYKAPNLAHVANSLSVNAPTCPDKDFTVSFQFQNIGDIILAGGVPITFYSGDPTQAGAVKLNTVIANVSLDVDEIYTATNLVVNGPGSAFTLYIVLNDNGSTVPTPIRLPNTNFFECDYGDNVVMAPITPGPVALTGVLVRDNIGCGGTPPNGAVRAYVPNGAIQNTTDYNFYWSIGTTAKPVPADFTGPTMAGLVGNTYTVYAIHKTAGCSSDTVQVVVGDVIPPMPVPKIIVDQPNTDCKTPNGKMHVVVNDFDNDGNGDPTGNFTYQWFIGPNPLGTVISTSHTATTLTGPDYSVLVTDKATGCSDFAVEVLPNLAIKPVITVSAPDLSCSSAATTLATATVVTGPAGGYKFDWYDGVSVKPTPDYSNSPTQTLGGGNYTVVASSNATNCESDPMPLTIIKTTPPAISITKNNDQISCQPSNPMGSATVNIPGAAANYDIRWYNGQTTAAGSERTADHNLLTLGGLIPGYYTVKVLELATNCSSTAQVQILNGIVPVVINSQIVGSSTTCFPANGNIEVTSITPGVPDDYDYVWFDVTNNLPIADTDKRIDGLSPGNYRVVATHKITKCVSPAKVIPVGDGTTPISTTTPAQIPATDCFGSGTLFATATGNVGGYDFEWYDGGTATGTRLKLETGNSSSYTDMSGQYTVKITDRDSRCFIELPQFLGFTGSHDITLSNLDILKCEPLLDGEITSILAPSPGLTDADYVMVSYPGSLDPGQSDPTGPTTGSTPLTLTGANQFQTTAPMDDGFYTIVAISQTAPTQFCRVAKTIEVKRVTTDPAINAALSPVINNSNCNVTTMGSGSVSITMMAGAAADYSYTWTDASGTALPGANIGGPNGQNAINLIPGQYTVNINTTAALNEGCASSQTFSILDVPTQIFVTAGDLGTTAVTHCDPVDGFTPITEGAAIFNTIRVDAGQVNAPYAGYTFDWRNETGTPAPVDGNAQAWDLVNLAPGNYYVTALDAVSNCSVTADFTIDDMTINTVGVNLINFQKEIRCIDPQAGFLEIAATGTTTNFGYAWYDGSAVKPVTDYPGVTTLLSNLFSVNQFTVKVTNNDNNCWVSDSYTIPQELIPIVITTASTPLTDCVNAELGTTDNASTSALVVFVGYDPVTGAPRPIPPATDIDMVWYIDGVASGTAYSLSNLGTADFVGHTISVIAYDRVDPDPTLCRSAEMIVPVTDERIYPAVIANPLRAVSNCDPTIPNGMAIASVGGDIINYTFDWFLGTPVPPVVSPGFYRGEQLSDIPANTVYTVLATDRVTGCTNTDTTMVDFVPTPVPAPDVEIIQQVTSCIMDNGILSVSVNGSTANHTFYWYNQAVTLPPPPQPAPVPFDFEGEIYDSLAADNRYYVIATDRVTGCTSMSSEILINDPAFTDFGFNMLPATCGDANGFLSIFMLDATEIDTIVWYSNGTPIGGGPNLQDIPTGDYSVTVTTFLGCTTSKDVTVGTEIKPYNGVSRNGDGRNDTFWIDCIESFPDNHVKIFNRAGTLVFEADGYDNIDIYFDGVSNKGTSIMGTNLPDGTYFFVVDKRDGSKPVAGYLEIVN